MKTTKIIYWISTVLFAGFMALSAIPDIMMSAEAVDFIKKLAIPNTSFLSLEWQNSLEALLCLFLHSRE